MFFLKCILNSTLLLMLTHISAFAHPVQNRSWVVLERRTLDLASCAPNTDCSHKSTYTTKFIEDLSPEQTDAMLNSIERLAKAQGHSTDHPEAPQFCSANPRTLTQDIAEGMRVNDKSFALKGLQGVFFNVTGMTGPPNYEGRFGLELQAIMQKKFQRAGLKVLTEDEMENTPGKPVFNVYFSNSNPNTGCTYKLFAGLRQTMLLTRNLDIKLKVGTWGSVGGYSADYPGASELDAIIRVVDKFLDDYKHANDPS